MIAAPLTEDHIANLVKVFYERARSHPSLGPLFNMVVTDWDQHLGVVHDFWSHVLLGTKRYYRHPFPAHVNLPIRHEHFDQWLDLFRPTAYETLPEEAAVRAIARAELVTSSFRAGLFPIKPAK
jgi:hemoglobin